MNFPLVGPQALLSPDFFHQHHSLLSENTTFEFGEFSSRTLAGIHTTVYVHISWGILPLAYDCSFQFFISSLRRSFLHATAQYFWNQVPLKHNSYAELMVKPSIEDFILFLVPQLFPSGLKSIKGKERLNRSRTLQSPPRHKSPSTSTVSCLSKPLSSPRSSNEQSQAVTN